MLTIWLLSKSLKEHTQSNAKARQNYEWQKECTEVKYVHHVQDNVRRDELHLWNLLQTAVDDVSVFVCGIIVIIQTYTRLCVGECRSLIAQHLQRAKRVRNAFKHIVRQMAETGCLRYVAETDVCASQCTGN